MTTLRTGRVVPEGVCTVPGGGGRGLCALGGAFDRDFVQCRPHQVYKVPSRRCRQCTKPTTPRGAPYKPRPKRCRQCTNPDFAHWEGSSTGTLYSAQRRRPGVCALEGPLRRGFVQCRPHPAYKPPQKRCHQCTKPTTPRGAPYKPPFRRCHQCTKPTTPRSPVCKTFFQTRLALYTPASVLLASIGLLHAPLPSV